MMVKISVTVLYFFIAIFFSELYAQSSNIQADKYFEIANKYFDKNDYSNAILYYDSTIYANTEHVEAYAFRGICRFELKEFEEAIKDFDFAIMLAPGYAEVFYYRGIAKFELGYKEKACNDWFDSYNFGFKKALKIIEKNCKDVFKEKSKK